MLRTFGKAIRDFVVMGGLGGLLVLGIDAAPYVGTYLDFGPEDVAQAVAIMTIALGFYRTVRERGWLKTLADLQTTSGSRTNSQGGL